MNPHQWFLLGFSGQKQPNTFIGGVAGTINTSQLLADKLLNLDNTAFNANNIENFTIIGNDIQCFIKTDYKIRDDSFSGNLSIKYYRDTGNKLKMLNNRVFISANSMVEIKADGMQQLIGTFAFSNTAIRNLIFPNLTTAGNSSFGNNLASPTVQTFIYIPIVQNLGGSVLNNDVFKEIKAGSIIIVNPAMQTVNGGAEDGDLVNARNLGAEIRYKTNSTAPNVVADLAVTQVWEDAVKLSWTTPSGSTNAIESFDLYQNDVFIKNITGNEAFATNLLPSTNYSFKLISVDIFYNKSSFSNVVSQITNALGSGRSVDTLVPKLISSYRLNSDLVDVVNAYNGTGTAITYATGKVSNAAVFNGTSSFISIADQNVFSFTDGTNDKPFSISMWVKYTGTGVGWLINKRDASNSEWQLMKYLGKLQCVLFSENSNAIYKVSEIAFTPIAGTTYYFTVTYSGTGYPKIYINTVLQSTTNTTVGTYTKMSNTTAPVILGKAGWFSGFYFNGSQDAVHIFSQELTPTEIANLFNFENAGGQLI